MAKVPPRGRPAARPSAAAAKARRAAPGAAQPRSARGKERPAPPRGRDGASAPRAGRSPRQRPALAEATADILARAIPNPRCELDHRDAWQLVIATILSAQCTDQRVNAVTPTLFRRWKTPRALAAAPLDEVEDVVRPTGFYRSKARSIVATAARVERDFAGTVPRTMEEMLTLPGVARKTANVVLGTAYGIATGMVVDTHVGRVARRLGLSASEDPREVESDLCALFPRQAWIATGHRLLLHGRYVCLARAPRCGDCPLGEICPSRLEPPAGPLEARIAAERNLVEGRIER